MFTHHFFNHLTEFRIFTQIRLCIFTSLSDLVSFISIPCTGFADNSDICCQIQNISLFGNTLSKHDIKLCFTEWRCYFVFYDFDTGMVTNDFSCLLELFYTAHVSIAYLAAALAVWALLIVLNRNLRIMALSPYLLGGALMWLFMLKSGVHATIAGVMLAFAIPYSAKDEDQDSPSHKLENILHKPVAFLILPIFALANTAVLIGEQWMQGLASSNSLGIIAGLVLGKPLGVTLFCFLAVAIGVSSLPNPLNWKHIFGAGILGGIGFTMSIFITNLAYTGNTPMIDASKMAILLASLLAGGLGILWLRLVSKPVAET